MPSGYWVLDANGIVLAHVYSQPDGAIAISECRLTNDEARRISKLIARLPELVELEKDRNKARSRRTRQPLRSKPVTIGDSSTMAGFWRSAAAVVGRRGTSISILKFYACLSAYQTEVASHLVGSKCGVSTVA
jgi:hypothetical protein